MKIPTNTIDFGIKRCLQSSRRINKLANTALDDYEPMGSFNLKQHDSVYAIVLFYYALEELGKAIRLEKLKKDAITQNLADVTDTGLFRDHDYKINITKEMYPHLIIPELQREYLKENTYQLVPSGNEIINNFLERSNLWLVGYHPNSGKWKLGLEDVDDEEIQKKIKDLDIILDEWMDKYGKLTSKPNPFDDGS